MRNRHHACALSRPRRAPASGFTLIELIVTIVLIGALAGVASVFIVQPFTANEDLQRRAALVDAADQALDRITRDARRSLPNSLRTEHNGHVEFIAVRTGGRYRQGRGEGDEDTFTAASQGSFEVLGGLLNAGSVQANDVGVADCATGTGDCLSVYNTGQEDYNAYEGNNIASLNSETDSDTIHYDTEGSGFEDIRSEPQRFYIFHDVVSYICEGRQLYRYTGYGLQSSQPQSGDAVLNDGVKRLVANDVDPDTCDFDFRTGAATRRGLLTIELSLSRDGETVTLLDQAQVPNTP